MVRLVIIALVGAAIITQVTLGYQTSAVLSCGGKPATLYNWITSPSFAKNEAPSAKDGCVAYGPPPCAYPQYSLPPVAARTVQLLNAVGSRVGLAGVPALTGIVVSSPGIIQQTGPATFLQTPSPVMMPPAPPAVLEQPPDPKTSSYVMTIPKKSDQPPTTTYTTVPSTDSCSLPNSVYSPTPPTTAPRPFYYTQQASFITSCPATVFYQASPALTYSQPPVVTYSVDSSLPTNPPSKTVYTPPSTVVSSVSNNSASATATLPSPQPTPAAASASAAASSAVKDPLLTFKLLANSKQTSASGSQDCSVPTPPTLV